MEKVVIIRCRKSDAGKVASILEETAKEYTVRLKTEIPKFKDTDIKCQLTVDTKEYLSEMNTGEAGLPSW